MNTCNQETGRGLLASAAGKMVKRIRATRKGEPGSGMLRLDTPLSARIWAPFDNKI